LRMICSGVCRRRDISGPFLSPPTMTETIGPHNYWTTTRGSGHFADSFNMIIVSERQQSPTMVAHHPGRDHQSVSRT